jgi:hypothetical protein
MFMKKFHWGVYINSFSPHNNPLKNALLYPSFSDESTKPQRKTAYGLTGRMWQGWYWDLMRFEPKGGSYHCRGLIASHLLLSTIELKALRHWTTYDSWHGIHQSHSFALTQGKNHISLPLVWFSLYLLHLRE